MDNICHALVGAAMGEAGLKRRTALGMATLIIGANLPDLDVLAVPLGHGLDFRRGWTHGVLALTLWPFVLTALMMAWDRFVRRRRRPGATPARPGPLLLLATLSILSHPLLDYMNDYGMRWLMPFSGQWFYGDAIFIVDIWMWLALGLGVFLTRRLAKSTAGASRRPAWWALGFVTVYVIALFSLAVASREVVQQALEAQGFAQAEPMMAGPVLINPFRKRIIFSDGDAYRFGTLTWTPASRLVLDDDRLPTLADTPAARAAAATPEGRAFLSWSRFPFYTVTEDAKGRLVRMADARYTTRGASSWAMVTVRLPPTIE